MSGVTFSSYSLWIRECTKQKIPVVNMKTEPAIISWKNYAAQTYDFIADKSCELFSFFL